MFPREKNKCPNTNETQKFGEHESQKCELPSRCGRVPDDGHGGGVCHGARCADDAEVRVPPPQMDVVVDCCVGRCADSVPRVLVFRGSAQGDIARARLSVRDAHLASHVLPSATGRVMRAHAAGAMRMQWRQAVDEAVLMAGVDRASSAVAVRVRVCDRALRACTLRGMPRAAQ